MGWQRHHAIACAGVSVMLALFTVSTYGIRGELS